MKKIVILTSRPGPDCALIALLNMVFPDCEIRVVFGINEGPIEEVTAVPSFDSLLKTV